jgi:hypothetical protein
MFLLPFFQENTAPFVASEPVPAVVGTKIFGNLGFLSCFYFLKIANIARISRYYESNFCDVH